MKKITLGNFYGKEIFLETEDSDVFNYVKAFEDYREMEKRHAIEQEQNKHYLKV